jgi:hypothetical protein
MTARSPPSTAYDYAPRARLVSLRAPSRRAGEIRERVRGGAHGFRSDATRCDDDTSRRVARRARARMGERASQWEHQAQFAGELFVGTSALVGGFLTFMYCHLRAQKRRRDRERLLSRQQEALL